MLSHKNQRFPRITLACLTLILFLGTLARAATEQLTLADVQLIMGQAITKARVVNPRSIIAVVDREGFVLGVWDVAGRLPNPLPPLTPLDVTDKSETASINVYGLIAGAVTRAGTAAFLSSNQDAFTSRTAGFIIQQHFPPGVSNTANGPLVGVGFSNLFYSDVNRFKKIPANFDPLSLVDPADSTKTISGGVRGETVVFGSLNDSPGGVPLYKNGQLVGGIGVTGDGSPTDLAPAAAILSGFSQPDATTGYKVGRDTDEDVALAGQTNFRPSEAIHATKVLINGIRFPYVGMRAEDIPDLKEVKPWLKVGNAVSGYSLKASPTLFPYPKATLGGVAGEIRLPIIDDPLINHPTRSHIGPAARLSAAEVTEILSAAAARAGNLRAAIRLPIGTSAKVFITVVSNPARADEKPVVLGTFRTGEATMFAWDVSAQKARSALFFSNRQLAQSTRTIGFLAQQFYPPGLDGRDSGPLFGFQEAISLKQREGATATDLRFPGNLNLPNGVTIFPGGFPLYRNGYLVGAIGISGDGVDQDDLIGISGAAAGFLAPKAIRADQFIYRGARLPYFKGPRDPEL